MLYLIIFFRCLSFRISSWTTEGKASKVKDTTIRASKGINRVVKPLQKFRTLKFAYILFCGNLGGKLDHEVKLVFVVSSFLQSFFK